MNNLHFEPQSPADYATRIINYTNKNIFLTGKAGTGKTTFLKNIINKTHKKTVIVAPTGIAAINAGGVTIHSQFQLPFSPFVPSNNFNNASFPHLKINNPDTLIKHLQMGSSKRQVLREMELLIIDEVSMLRCDLLDAIDTVLKSVRKNTRDFGGVQVLFIGDLYQLPPVVKDDEWQILKEYYRSPLFFNAWCLVNKLPVYIELDKIYRQDDKKFINLLNNLRNNEVTEDDIEILQEHYKPGFVTPENEKYIILATHNHKVDTINRSKLEALDARPYVFEAKITGEFSEYAYPVEKNLELKKGAQVMFIKNDPTGNQKFFNGKLATIKDVSTGKVKVHFEEEEDELELELYKWRNIKFEVNKATDEIEEIEIGSFEQFPVKLAWAITVHKSQGLTFERAILDIGNAFAPGQVYVALSRLKSLDGLIMLNPPHHLRLYMDEHIVEFSNNKTKAHSLESIIKEESLLYTRHYISDCYNFNRLVYFIQEYVKSFTPLRSLPGIATLYEASEQFVTELIQLKKIAEKFVNEIFTITSGNEPEYEHRLSSRVQSASNYFSEAIATFTEKLDRHIVLVKEDKRCKDQLKILKEVHFSLLRQKKEMAKAVAFTNSLVEKKVFDKEAINQVNKKYAQLEGEILTTGKKKNGVKEDTKKVSFDLFSSGLSAAEIANQRNLSVGTIEGHLAHFLSIGKIELAKVMNPAKADLILKEIESMEKLSLSVLKQQLGDDFTYGEIKFALGWKTFRESQTAE